eukprot:TRINITY_DN13343_c0_g1_i6.p1 TRINITY_DN13343_c0_g1~~TRINITY_DN13343_c0_g1_i6.p1  ORF type:complete len:383 (+),score=106.84 TRINITY_DN13343_c0_g1_i6:30-1151(+)
MDGGTGGAEEIIQGIGNEVFYFFMLLSLLLVIVGAWFSTQVVEPVVSSVILVERTSPSPDGPRREGENRSEYIQYRLDSNSARHRVSLLTSLEQGARAQIQQNYTADLQRITEPRRRDGESSGSSQASESNSQGVSVGTSPTAPTDAPSPSSTTSAPQQQSQNHHRPVVGGGERQDNDDNNTVPLSPIPEEQKVTVRLKFLNDTERDVEASLLENLATFRRRNFTEEISENKSVRFIFNGQMLREEANTLRSYGMFDKCVVHCLIQQQQQQPVRGGGGAAGATASANNANAAGGGGGGDPQQQEQNLEDDQDLDLSEMFIPVLGFGLIVLWYFAFTYSTYFNSMSTSALLGLTSLFLFTMYGTNVHINVITRN